MWPFKRKQPQRFDEATYRGRLLNARVAVNHPLINPDGETLNPSDRSISGILDDLILQMESSGDSACEEEKLEHFKQAVLAMNRLNDRHDGGLIETVEREDLCETLNAMARIAGIDPTNYGGGEGVASEWRDW